MPKKISINIMSNKSIQNAVKEVENYAYSLTDKCNEFAKKLAQIGVQTAKMKVAQYDAGLYRMNFLAVSIMSKGRSLKKVQRGLCTLAVLGPNLLSLVQVLSERKIRIPILALLVGSMT